MTSTEWPWRVEDDDIFRSWSYKYALTECKVLSFTLSYCTLQLHWSSVEIFTVDFIVLTLSKELRLWLYSLLDGICKTPDCIKSGKNENAYVLN